MAKKTKNNNLFLILSIVFFISSVIFVSLYFTANSKILNLKNEINLQQTTIQNLESQLPTLSEAEVSELQSRSNILDEIGVFQKESLKHIAEAEVISANLAEYQTQWSESEVGSSVESRALDRYQEELDELEALVAENNALMDSNRDLLSTYLFVNADEQIAANNFLLDSYEDEYYNMLNYEE